jgi:hypothetical protein
VIIEPVEELDFAAVGELPVGEVGLPTLVGLGGGCPNPWEGALVGVERPSIFAKQNFNSTPFPLANTADL